MMSTPHHASSPSGSAHPRRAWRAPLALTAAVALAITPLAALPSTAAGTAGGDSSSAASLDGASVRAAQDPAGGMADQFIIGYSAEASLSSKSSRSQAWQSAARQAGVSAQEVKTTATGGYVVRTEEPLTQAAAQKFMAAVEASPAVDYVEVDSLQTIALTPADARYGELWGFHGTNGMRVPGAWDVSTGKGSVVAVLDTGIVSHPDLNANIIPGYDFVSDATSARDGNGRDSNPRDEGDWYLAGECGAPRPSDSSWHGSHVAGTIAAVSDSTGVVGVAPGAKVQPVRVLAKCGGRLSDITDAIVWASGGTVSGVPANPTPADVINMSLGGNGRCTVTYQNAINQATSRGTAVVVAAGNESQDASLVQPASCENVITVASSTKAGALSYFSNFGTRVDVTAPGGDTSVAGGGILSTVDAGTTTPRGGSYASYQGTSMATPHVAGLVALMNSVKPTLTPAQVESALKSGTRPLPAGCSAGCGTGLVDATVVMNRLGTGTTPTPTPDPTPTGQLLKNNGFESGLRDWTVSHTDAIENNADSRTGSWHAALNGWGKANTYTVDQQVTLPAGRTATLDYYLRVDTAEGISRAYDTLSVQVLDGSTTTVKSHSNMNRSTGYVAQSVDLSRFAGKTVTLRFRGVEDVSAATTFRIDDAALTVR